jgi:hypothetical protein
MKNSKSSNCTATDKDFEEYEQGNGITPCSDYGDCQYCPYCEVWDDDEGEEDEKHNTNRP